MRKIKLYIATSLNGKIAKSDGDVAWLESMPNPDGIDYGYAEFCNSVDTTIMGYNTYNQIISWGIEFPYSDKKNFVLTNKADLEKSEYVEFISKNHIETIQKIKEESGKDIWLIGGGLVNTLLLNAGLIDEIQIFIMPIVIEGGIEVFEKNTFDTQFELVSVKPFPTGAIEIIYKPKIISENK